MYSMYGVLIAVVIEVGKRVFSMYTPKSMYDYLLQLYQCP